MAKLVYRPFGMVLGVLGGLLAGAIVKQAWKLATHREDTPKPKDSEYGWAEVLTAAAIQGAVFAFVKAAVDRSGARAFEKLTGSWPGD